MIAAAFLGACSDKPDEGATSLPRATTTTSTTTLAERYAVPDTITVEYVNDVLAALNHVYGDVVRTYIERRELSPQDLVPLQSIYSEPEFKEQAASIARSPLQPRGEYPPTIGDRKITVDKLLSVSPTCVSIEATYDFTAVAEQSAPPSKGWLSLRPKPTVNEPGGPNPTPWIISSESNDPEDACV